jgi:Flp pilus assembly protein TadD
VLLQRQHLPGSSERAQAAFFEAIRLDPGNASAHYGLGRVLMRRRQWKEAADVLRQAVRLEPGLARAHYALSQVYRRLGRTQESRAHLKAFQRAGGSRDAGDEVRP